jgi:ATP-dependent DNA helicase RecG
MNFDHRVETLKGVGKTAAAKLERLGIVTVGDLLKHYPRRYDDFSNIIPIRAMRPGLVTFRGRVERIASRRARSRRLHITEAIIRELPAVNTPVESCRFTPKPRASLPSNCAI